MKDFRTALLAASLLLAGCNTNDALIPREEIGAGTATSPLTQEETGRLARSPRPETASAAPRPLPAPQNTLEAQARALEGGSAVSPAASAPLAETAGQPAAQPAPPPASGALAARAPAGGDTIRFLPIIGAPVQAVTPLSRQLGAAARAGGLTIRSTADSGANHILKGYLSAYADGGQVTVVYVWDILDGAGARLHRIQGQESVAGRSADPWAAVPAATMEAIGEKTISAYREWLAGQRA